MIKRFLPAFFLTLVVLILGFAFHMDYQGATVGTVVGGMVGFIASEIRFRNE